MQGVVPQEVDAAFVVDESGDVLFATDQACRLLKLDSRELDGQTVENLMAEGLRLAHIGHRLRFTDDRRTRPMGAALDLFTPHKDRSELPVDIGLNSIQRGLQTLFVVTIQVCALDSRASARTDYR